MSDRRWTIIEDYEGRLGVRPYPMPEGPRAIGSKFIDVMPVPDDATVERVARALFDLDDLDHVEWDRQADWYKAGFRKMARAALAALMSPGEGS